MPWQQSIELELLDQRASYLDGAIFRAYEGPLPASFSAAPTGVLLAEFTIPSPSHNAAAWNAGQNRYEATMRGTWADQVADASGTFGCFTMTKDGVIVRRGTLGVAGSGATIIVSAATIAAGAPFTITQHTLTTTAMP